MKNITRYSVSRLAKLAGITPKALHLYDEIGLLKPAERTPSGYRLYGEKELLRLQQILFYKELDFPLKEIGQILDDPAFELIKALENHKQMLSSKKQRITTLLKTIDKTIYSIKNKTMLTSEELYKGLSAKDAVAYRNEAISKYGEEVVAHAENHLKTLDKIAMQGLVSTQKELGAQLHQLRGMSPESKEVQQLINLHYQNTRKLWGTHNSSDKQPDAYYGLGQLYLVDERFTSRYGEDNASFRNFISTAITIYVAENLK